MCKTSKKTRSMGLKARNNENQSHQSREQEAYKSLVREASWQKVTISRIWRNKAWRVRLQRISRYSNLYRQIWIAEDLCTSTYSRAPLKDLEHLQKSSAKNKQDNLKQPSSRSLRFKSHLPAKLVLSLKKTAKIQRTKRTPKYGMKDTLRALFTQK